MEGPAILKDVLFLTLFGGVTMLNAIAALYLLLRRGNAIAPEVTSPLRLRRWSAAFLIAMALSHVMWLFYIFHPFQNVYVALCCMDILLLIPTMAGSQLSMLQDRHRPVWPVLVALIPAVVLSALCIIRKDDIYFTATGIYVVSFYALLTLYMFLAVRKYGRWLRDNYADLENKEIWQSLLILAVFLLFFVVYGSSTDEGFFLYLLQADNILLVVLLLWRVETLQQLSEIALPDSEPADEVQKTSTPPPIPTNIGPLLKKICEDGQLYRQHNLTLSHLAQVIGTNRYYLSQHFAQQGLTYNAYINGLRIDHFTRLYHKAIAEQRIFTAQQLAFESGYHSYSTFSSAFKQIMGMTVTAWMRGTED